MSRNVPIALETEASTVPRHRVAEQYLLHTLKERPFAVVAYSLDRKISQRLQIRPWDAMPGGEQPFDFGGARQTMPARNVIKRLLAS